MNVQEEMALKNAVILLWNRNPLYYLISIWRLPSRILATQGHRRNAQCIDNDAARGPASCTVALWKDRLTRQLQGVPRDVSDRIDRIRTRLAKLSKPFDEIRHALASHASPPPHLIAPVAVTP